MGDGFPSAEDGRGGSATILIVDDEEPNRKMARRILEQDGYRVVEAADGEEALDKIRAQPPDLVVLDVIMPKLNGLGVCRQVKKDPTTRLIPIVVVTSLDEFEDRLLLLDAGADEFLSKPFRTAELKTRIKALLKIKKFTDELENAAQILGTIAKVVEERDRYTSDHCRQVGELSALVARRFGLDTAAIGALRMAATFHDIGKISIPDSVLHKPGRLDEEEWVMMRSHPLRGEALLAPLKKFKPALALVRSHHERLDGSGYPDGLKADQISLPLRILSVVDVYQALAMERPYKKAFPRERCLEILKEEAGKGWWDSKVVAELEIVLRDKAPNVGAFF